jgi:F0F1-type ATP synthase delta subunit
LSAVANRYAKALVDVCLKLSVQDRVAEDLLAFENLLNNQTELRSLYLNPAVPVNKKKAITAEILKRFSFTQPPPISSVCWSTSTASAISLLSERPFTSF